MASIAKRPNGTYRPRYRDENGKEHARHFKRKVDAQKWLDEATAAMVTGTYVDPAAGAVTFAAFYAQWSARQVWAPRTAEAMNLVAGSATFADLPLRKLRRSHMETWVKGMVARGLAPGTVHTRTNNVRAVLRGAVADRLIPRDPSEGVTLPRRRRAEAALRVPTPAEVGALLRAADEPFRAFVGLAAFAGLRLGEAAGLQVDDVDVAGRALRVSRQVQRAGGGKVDVRAPKHGSERTVYLAPTLVDMLADHIRDHSRDDWLFPAMNGDPITANTVGPRWRRTTTRAGVAGVRLHDLRAFYASGLIAAGCDVVTVQRALGHASASTTLAAYASLWPTAEDRTRAAAEAMPTDACGLGADSGVSASV